MNTLGIRSFIVWQPWEGIAFASGRGIGATTLTIVVVLTTIARAGSGQQYVSHGIVDSWQLELLHKLCNLRGDGPGALLKTHHLANKERIVDRALLIVQFHHIAVNSPHLRGPLRNALEEQLCRSRIHEHGNRSGKRVA